MCFVQLAKKQNGFTLIELILVIIILVVLAIVAAPKLINLQRDARIAVLNDTAAKVRATVQQVRYKAIVQNKLKSLENISVNGELLRVQYGWVSEGTMYGLFGTNRVEGGLSNAFISTSTFSAYRFWYGIERPRREFQLNCSVNYDTANVSPTNEPDITIITDGC